MPKHIYKKWFSQNFLNDTFVIQRIVAAVDPLSTDDFIELGPGLGALTEVLLPLVAKLSAIEIDQELANKLSASFLTFKNFFLYIDDILKIDLSTLFYQGKRIRLVGNLPYNISTPILFKLFQYMPYLFDMHFMFQKEVALRLSAVPGSKAYGKLTVMAQYHCKINRLFDVLPTAFFPTPKVNSSLVRLTPHHVNNMDVINPVLFKKLIIMSFNQRRKTLKNVFKEILTDDDWRMLSIKSNYRAEQLSVEDFVQLSNYVTNQKQIN